MPFPADRTPLTELAALFLRLGATAFGGPAAHIALMEDEVVRRRRWLARDEFLDLLGATNLIPGPNSTELAIHIGHRRAGWPGLLVAGTCFIAPAALIVCALAMAYQNWGTLPVATALLYGVKPVIVAVIAQALWGLGKTALKSWPLALVAAATAAAVLLGVPEITALLAMGGIRALAASVHHRIPPDRVPGPPLIALGWTSAAAAPLAAGTAFGLWPLFLFFLKVGSILFGSGYVLIAFLRADLVDRWHWLTESQLLDAVMVGQITPGPVFTTATFIGWILGGPGGAAAATVGIFLPAFAFVAISGPLVPRLRQSPVMAAFLDGVNAASLALMAVVAVPLARTAWPDPPALALSLVAAVLLIHRRVNSTWLIAAGALAGWLIHPR